MSRRLRPEPLPVGHPALATAGDGLEKPADILAAEPERTSLLGYGEPVHGGLNPGSVPRGQVVAGRSADLTAEQIVAAFLAEECDAKRGAARLGIARRTFDRWARRHGLEDRLQSDRAALLERQKVAAAARFEERRAQLARLRGYRA